MDETGLILSALRFAADKHRHQRRKDSHESPYINHPIEVVQLLWEVGTVRDPVALAAGALHDTIEDTDTDVGELEEAFGAEVRAVVQEVSDDKSLPKQTRKRLQVEHAPAKSTRAKLVKLADKISNLGDLLDSPPADWDLVRKREYGAWARSVVAGMRGTNAALEARFDVLYERGIAELGFPVEAQAKGTH
jgi:guanosine-3',5'-bis(diphosphate) 3'-pyrophosphohydrolase